MANRRCLTLPSLPLGLPSLETFFGLLGPRDSLSQVHRTETRLLANRLLEA